MCDPYFSNKYKLVTDLSKLFSVSRRVIYMGLANEENVLTRNFAKLPMNFWIYNAGSVPKLLGLLSPKMSQSCDGSIEDDNTFL